MRKIHAFPMNLVYPIVLLLALSLAGNLVLPAQTIRLAAVSDLARVFMDGYRLPPLYDTIKVFGLRGEIVSAQCAVNSKKNLTNVTFEVGALRSKSAGNTFPSSSVEWNFVGSIPLSKNTPNQPVVALTRPAPAEYPEYLMTEKQLSVNKGTWQAIWLTISIPENIQAGIYSGMVKLRSEQGEQSLPLELTVYPVNLPRERNLKVTEWYSTGHFSRVHGIQEKYSDAWFAMLKKYADNMVAHRQNVFQVQANTIEISRSAAGKLEFDFTRFDQIAEVFWSTGKMDYLETGELVRFGEGSWASTEIIHRDFNVKNQENGQQITLPGNEVLPELLPAIESHLRQKGWLHKTVFHIKDEPSLHNALSWQEMSQFVHHHAPDLRRIDAIETTYLMDDIEIAVPKLDALASWYETYREGQKKGVELWFYTVGIYQGSLLPNKTIDMPLIDSRILHWMNYRYDACGYLHWGWNQWSEDPFKEVGMHIGDGWHVYPAKDGVINSLRWEQMRNGIQDYECFVMLEKKICALKDSLGSRFSWINPKQRGKEISSQVVMDFAEHSDDPQALFNAKKEVIREIMEFTKSPRIYVQTDPPVRSMLTRHSSAGVFGWVEPGSRITVNGVEVPVSKDGLFLAQCGGEFIDERKLPLKDNITVVATSPKGSRTIVREFIVK